MLTEVHQETAGPNLSESKEWQVKRTPVHESKIYRIPMDGPHDVRGVEALIDKEGISIDEIQGIMITHEGDLFAKASTTMAFAQMLSEKAGRSPRDIARSVPFHAIAGISGFMVPHVAVFVRRDMTGTKEPGEGEKRLAIAGGCTRELLPEEAGTRAHAEEVSRRTRELVVEAGIEDPADVRFVFVKGRWASERDKEEATSRGQALVSDDWWTRGCLGRAACTLGAAHGIGELSDKDLQNVRFLDDADTIYSNVVHVSVGEERPSDAIVVMGNSRRSVSDAVIGSGVLSDGLDSSGIKSILREMGFVFDCCPSEADRQRIEYAFVKPKTSEVGTIRGHRHTIMTDLILGPYWWMVEKAPIHAVASEVLGTPIMEIATGPEHQGPVGQPLVAVVARASSS